MQRHLIRFEAVVILLVQALLVLTIVLTVATLAWLLIYEGIARLQGVDSVAALQPLVLRAFGGALLVLLGLELLDSLRTFSVRHQVRLELILVVAAIAVGRHIILLDLEHVPGTSIVGIACLMLALTGGYVLLTRSARQAPARED